MNGLDEQPVDQEQVGNPIGMLQHSPLVFKLIEVELRVLFVAQIGPAGVGGGDVFVVLGEVCGDAGVQAADDVIEHSLLGAHLADVLNGLVDAVLLVDQLPDV